MARPPGRELMHLLSLQGEWLQRIGTDQNLIAGFLRTRRVIGGTALGFLGHPAARDLEFDLCIFDEASKATATEALVPMARAKRWVLVGDTNQLPPIDEDLLRDEKIMADHQLIPELVKTTLFQYFANSTKAPVKHLLREQYRMTPAIGNMISSCFYDNKLISPNDHVLPATARLTNPSSGWTPAPCRTAARMSSPPRRPASPTVLRASSRCDAWKSSTGPSTRG